ncbi:hypothetical protein B0H12DRAFT_711636 [Mycena haematopus]|nr:hypothetical protein B0H12DRAFT_711636 [Mycena haematopus]
MSLCVRCYGRDLPGIMVYSSTVDAVSCTKPGSPRVHIFCSWSANGLLAIYHGARRVQQYTTHEDALSAFMSALGVWMDLVLLLWGIAGGARVSQAQSLSFRCIVRAPGLFHRSASPSSTVHWLSSMPPFHVFVLRPGLAFTTLLQDECRVLSGLYSVTT